MTDGTDGTRNFIELGLIHWWHISDSTCQQWSI